jgi:putative toxin-antitoxin system antitoxin component (TIGR02293 family)
MSTASDREGYVPPRASRAVGEGRSYDAIRLETDSLDELIRLLKEEGLSIEGFDRLKEKLDVPTSQLAGATQIAERTLRRRREAGRLRPDESERLLRLARLFDRACEVLGSVERARMWMKEPLPVLGGRPPLAYADTEPGAREVERVLGRVAHGVFS